MGRKVTNTAPDAFIARLAGNQHGVVSLAQLEQAGIHERGRRSRVASKRLHRIHRGVYAVGHCGLSEKGRWMAAVLACGPDAVLSHTSAAALWQLLPQRGSVHTTVPGNGRHQQGIRVHRSTTLFPSEVTRRADIPVTTPSRTLRDLRRLLPQPQFAQALREAEFLRLPIEPEFIPDHTRSELEARFLALLRHHRLPQPGVNLPVGRFTVDFLWRAEHLIVELDGFRAHAGRTAFEADRTRDIELKTLGYEVVRLTWQQITTHSARVARTLRKLLRARGQ